MVEGLPPLPRVGHEAIAVNGLGDGGDAFAVHTEGKSANGDACLRPANCRWHGIPPGRDCTERDARTM